MTSFYSVAISIVVDLKLTAKLFEINTNTSYLKKNVNEMYSVLSISTDGRRKVLATLLREVGYFFP